jgi:hypothetical protein
MDFCKLMLQKNFIQKNSTNKVWKKEQTLKKSLRRNREFIISDRKL